MKKIRVTSTYQPFDSKDAASPNPAPQESTTPGQQKVPAGEEAGFYPRNHSHLSSSSTLPRDGCLVQKSNIVTNPRLSRREFFSAQNGNHDWRQQPSPSQTHQTHQTHQPIRKSEPTPGYWPQDLDQYAAGPVAWNYRRTPSGSRASANLSLYTPKELVTHKPPAHGPLPGQQYSSLKHSRSPSPPVSHRFSRTRSVHFAPTTRDNSCDQARYRYSDQLYSDKSGHYDHQYRYDYSDNGHIYSELVTEKRQPLNSSNEGGRPLPQPHFKSSVARGGSLPRGILQNSERRTLSLERRNGLQRYH